jgi:hypothetical protein
MKANLQVLWALVLISALISCRIGSDGARTTNNGNQGQEVPTSKATGDSRQAPTKTVSAPSEMKRQVDTVTFKGRLRSNEAESTILYYGVESGDLAGFCFENDSDIGRTVLTKCKAGDLCEFTGEVDWNQQCPFGGGMFSAQARVTKLKSVRKVAK